MTLILLDNALPLVQTHSVEGCIFYSLEIRAQSIEGGHRSYSLFLVILVVGCK